MYKNVIAIIDGQAGSSGKGKLCGYIAQKDNILYATNNWGSNSGHTYIDEEHGNVITSHIPLSMLNPECKLLLNAGAIITPEILEDEIRKYSNILGNRKIYIHPRAMIIQNKHRKEEVKNINSGSTFKGVGAAYAEKIMRREDVKLAYNYREFFSNAIKDKIIITDTAKILNETNSTILVEGAQGCDLDINYGLDYPNVTSRQCSASQIIADAGISPLKVKEVIMVIRPYPIRISNITNIGEKYSGDYGKSKETTWNEIARRAGAKGDITEYTTVTKRIRRVFEMNWDRLVYNVMINKPTQIMLNFAQYIDWNAYRCTDYKKLPIKVKLFIKTIEDKTNVPVTFIGTGAENKFIIDIRNRKE